VLLSLLSFVFTLNTNLERESTGKPFRSHWFSEIILSLH